MDITAQAQKPVSEFLKVPQELVLEVREWASVLWVKVQGCRPRFVSKKVLMPSFDLKKIETFMDCVIVDVKNTDVAYCVRTGYDCPSIVKKFNPRGKDLRIIDISRLNTKPIENFSNEYNAVLEAKRSK